MIIHHDSDVIYIEIEGDISFNNAQDIRKTILNNLLETDRNAVLNLPKLILWIVRGWHFHNPLKRVKERGGELILEQPRDGTEDIRNNQAGRTVGNKNINV